MVCRTAFFICCKAASYCSRDGRSDIILASSMDTGLMSIPMKRRFRKAHSLAMRPDPTKGSTTRSFGCVNFSTRKPRHSMGFLPQYLWNADKPVYPVGVITSAIDTIIGAKSNASCSLGSFTTSGCDFVWPYFIILFRSTWYYGSKIATLDTRKRVVMRQYSTFVTITYSQKNAL